MPVVMNFSGVFGIAALTSRIRSHGSSRWKRTDTAMCVLAVKSSARKPTRSIIGAIASTSGVVSPVAPHRLWLPSRSRGVDDLDALAHATAARSSQLVVTAPAAKSSCASTLVEQRAVRLHALDLEAGERGAQHVASAASRSSPCAISLASSES